MGCWCWTWPAVNCKRAVSPSECWNDCSYKLAEYWVGSESLTTAVDARWGDACIDRER